MPEVPKEDCEVPAQNECCKALASCGPALCLGATSIVVAVVAEGANLTYARTMHASAIAAPEPPPPRV